MFYLLAIGFIHSLSSSALGAMAVLSLKALRAIRRELAPRRPA